jgi:hypothetical protein
VAGPRSTRPAASTSTCINRRGPRRGFGPPPAPKEERAEAERSHHTVWRRDGFDHLTINYHGKHLDNRSVQSSFRTLGIKKDDFWAYLKTDTIPEPLAARLREYEHGRVVSDCLTTGPEARMKARDSGPTGRKREANVMNTSAVIVEGTVQPDGTLEVTQKVDLPAGSVHVTVQPDRFWTMMDSIWAVQLSRTTRRAG